MKPVDQAQPANIDALLPQTQCTQCGYPGCLPYAEAIAAGHAKINQCPPGGDTGIRRLSTLLGQPYIPLNPDNGTEKPRRVALIDETACIGCTLCIQACPVDAIIGGAKYMHTVIADRCTGCDLCLPPCPVDCIAMIPTKDADIEWTGTHANAARERHKRRQERLQKPHDGSSELTHDAHLAGKTEDSRQALVRAAIERARIARQKSAPK